MFASVVGRYQICLFKIYRRIDRRANRTLTSPMSVELNEPTAENLKRVMSSWPTGVGLITTTSSQVDGLTGSVGEPRAVDKPVGILCNSLASISLEKKLILWSVDHSSSTYQYWMDAKTWAVHFLADDQQNIIEQFKQKGALNKFENIEYSLSKEGNPILSGAVAILHCNTVNFVKTYDHTVILGEVINLEIFDKNPMVYAFSKFTSYGS